MRRVVRWIDRAGWLGRLLDWISPTLARQRGLPILASIPFTILSFVAITIWLVTDNKVVALIGFGLLHFAILTGLLGVLLAEPLGREFVRSEQRRRQ